MASTPQPVRLADDVRRRKHADALRGLIEGEVRFDSHSRMLYATDASIYQVEPVGVVIPSSVDDITAAVRYCAEYDLPILPRGGGTSLAGQCTNHAVVIDVSAHCTNLTALDVDARRCRVEAGLTIDDLNDRIRSAGLFFAPDPSTARQANIGGCIGNNAAGTRSIRYGRTSENIEGVSAILLAATPDGKGESEAWSVELSAGAAAKNAGLRALTQSLIDIVTANERLIRERFPKTIRRNAGYALDTILAQIDRARDAGRDPFESVDLSQLICGSEGTLAVVTHAILKLHRLPKAKGLAVVGLDSVDRAVEIVPLLLALKPTAVELLDDMVLDMARRNIACAPAVDLMPQPNRVQGDGGGGGGGGERPELKAVLYVEFFSDDGPDEIENSLHNLRNVIALNAPGAGVNTYTNATSMDRALALRKAGEPLLHGIPGERKPLSFVEDNVVPVERLPEFVRRFREIVESRGTRAAFWAHASVGVLHVRPLLSLRSAGDRKLMEEIAVEAADLARELGGVMSGEHGDGRARGPLLERHFGPELMSAFREIKRLFDPRNLLNPGNIVEPGPIASIHESTRVQPEGSNVERATIETYFDYSAEDGFEHAVELCNGSGVCRKRSTGTMCPSYMATLDERHSTRGRGNALRLAITGQLNAAAAKGEDARPLWNDPETLATLDLCLSCKACKSECPTNVDIARFKAEYLAQSYRVAGHIPLAVRAFANVRTLNRMGSRFAPLSNWVAGSGPARAISNRMLNLHPSRSLPPFARGLFGAIRNPRHAVNSGVPSDAPAVLLFGDCFTAYSEPHIGLAAIRVLNGFGYRVEVIDAGCCGRPHISNGLLGQAQRLIPRTARNLAGAIERTCAQAVLVCEPSCLSAMTDDWEQLCTGGRKGNDGSTTADLSSVRALAALPEDFLADHWADHPRQPAFRVGRGRLMLHAHCHQKALLGPDSSAQFLRLISDGPDLVHVLDSGCCGMAGAFGFTKDHYDLSMKIGELSLFPAARALREGELLVAPGSSCRHQILDGVGVRALHPMEIAARALCD